MIWGEDTDERFSDKALVALLDSAACGTMPADNTVETEEEPGEGADAD